MAIPGSSAECVGREVEPPPADLESTEAMEAQKQWPFGRVAQASGVLKSRGPGETHPLVKCLPGGIPIPAVST